MSYTNLKIDRSKLVSSIYEKCESEGYESYDIKPLQNVDGKRYRLDITIDGKSFFLDFFFKKDYTTSIQTGQGGNQDLQEIFAKHIYEDKSLHTDNYIELNKKYELLLDDDRKSNDTIVYKRLSDDVYSKLLVVLREEICCRKIQEIKNSSEQRICKIYDSSNNEVTLTDFNTSKGHTLMLQGRPKTLFAVCAAGVAESIDRKDNLDALNAFYGTSTTLEEIEQEYEEMFANSKKYIASKLKKCICQALQNRRDLAEKFDYTYLAAPAERALEGHIRYVFAGVLTGNNINLFDPIKNLNGEVTGYILQKAHWGHLGNDKKRVECISRAYTYMHFVRNDLSHWDNPNKLGYDTTRQLSSQEVDRVIVDALKLIEEYYS